MRGKSASFIKNRLQTKAVVSDGKRGIRTPGKPEPTTDFESVRFNHSRIFPIVVYPRGLEPPTFGSANQCSIQLSYRYIKTNGKGGIRTPGTLEGYNSLAGRPIRPLSHLSNLRRNGDSNPGMLAHQRFSRPPP